MTTDLNHRAFIIATLAQCYSNDLRDEMANDDPKLVPWIVKAIEPLLKGFSPQIQGAVLADLTAMWLAGHIGPDREAFRDMLLDDHIQLVRDLIPACEQQLAERMETQGRA